MSSAKGSNEVSPRPSSPASVLKLLRRSIEGCATAEDPSAPRRELHVIALLGRDLLRITLDERVCERHLAGGRAAVFRRNRSLRPVPVSPRPIWSMVWPLAARV